MKKVAEEQTAKVTQEAAATIEEMVFPSTKVTFGAGVTVQRVITGCETCRVLVKNLPLTATKAEVITLFTQPGFDPTKFTVHPLHASPTDQSHLEAVVEFEHLEDGKNAVAGLDEIEFGLEKVKLVLVSKQGGTGKFKDLDPCTLTVVWPAPSNTVFASYPSLEEAHYKRTQLENRTFNGWKIRVNIAKKPPNLPNVYWNPATISVNGLEPDASLASIQEFCGTTTIKIPPRTSRSYNLNDAIPTLQSLVARVHLQGHDSVTYEPNLVPNERGAVSAKLHFLTREHAKVVRDFLDQKPLPFCAEAKYFAFLPDPLHYKMRIPYPQYKAQEKLFQSLIPTPTDDSAIISLHILADQPGQPARINLSGSDKKTVGRLKVRIEQLTAGEKLPQWNRVFYGTEGERILEKVNDESRAYIRVDKRKRTLKAFGEPAAIERAKAMIQEEVDRLASLQFEVPLKRGSVRFFVDGARGSTLLKQEAGEENVTLDVSSTPCKIVVRGGESARHLLKKLIHESLSDAIRSQHQLKDAEETCPVCYDPSTSRTVWLVATLTATVAFATSSSLPATPNGSRCRVWVMRGSVVFRFPFQSYNGSWSLRKSSICWKSRSWTTSIGIQTRSGTAPLLTVPKSTLSRLSMGVGFSGADCALCQLVCPVGRITRGSVARSGRYIRIRRRRRGCWRGGLRAARTSRSARSAKS